MKSPVRQKILDAFRKAGGGYLSGEKIAGEIGISRTAVWKHIAELRKEGFLVEGVPKKGYRLRETPGEWSEEEIYWGLETKRIGRPIRFFETVDSTQKIAHELAANGAEEGTIVLADEQTMGRGRLSRGWHSKKGKGIWMSLIIRPDIAVQKAPQFTLLAAVGVAGAIEDVAGLSPKIKWPNDLLIEGKKVCGILTEMVSQENRVLAIIIGIGINVNHRPGDFPDALKDKATSLAIHAGKEIPRAKLVQSFCLKFERLYDTYLKAGFLPVKTLWETYACSIGQRIEARMVQGTIRGKALGIDEEGVLLLQDDSGRIHHIYSADIEIEKDV